MDDYIPKPVSEADLKAALGRVPASTTVVSPLAATKPVLQGK
jgi:hypothetical protein